MNLQVLFPDTVKTKMFRRTKNNPYFYTFSIYLSLEMYNNYSIYKMMKISLK